MKRWARRSFRVTPFRRSVFLDALPRSTGRSCGFVISKILLQFPRREPFERRVPKQILYERTAYRGDALVPTFSLSDSVRAILECWWLTLMRSSAVGNANTSLTESMFTSKDCRHIATLQPLCASRLRTGRYGSLAVEPAT